MTDRELMQQALEVLEQHVEHYDYEHFTSVCELDPAKGLILALRERLAQPAPGCAECGKSGGWALYCVECMEKLTQPEQETVMAEYKFQTYAAYKTPDGEMKIGVMPTTRPATREEKIVRPGVYEVTGPLHVVCQCDKCKAQPEQEPVAWVTGWHDGHCVIRAANPAAILPIGIALYTTPPRREWVGLTDEEKLHLEIMGGKSDVMLAEAIEAKLKEKNA